MATAYEILRQIVVIGMLPKSKVRADLIAVYQQNLVALTTLIPVGKHDAPLPVVTVADIEALTGGEMVAFIKGAALILGPSLQYGKHCICNMPGCVILPVAAYVALLREDVGLARKNWKTFAKIPRLCGEKLPIRMEEVDQQLDLRRLTFDQFIAELTGDGGDLSESELGRVAAERIEKAFEIERYRR